MEYYNLIKEKIDEADLVLIGLGEEFQYNWKLLEQDEHYRNSVKKIADKAYLDSYLQKISIEQNVDTDLANAYNHLYSLIRGKDYFVVNLSIDDAIYKSGLETERIVSPCGGFSLLQCDANCSDKLYKIPTEYLESIKGLYIDESTSEEIADLKCPACGAPLVFNQLGAGKYCEKGYTELWANYMKWLQKTVNRKLCILELGAGLQFPSIIRNPFEKIMQYNQKASFFRIHSMFFQIETDNDNCYGIKCNAKDFMKDFAL